MIEDIKVIQKYQKLLKGYYESEWEILVKYSGSDEWVPIKIEHEYEEAA